MVRVRTLVAQNVSSSSDLALWAPHRGDPRRSTEGSQSRRECWTFGSFQGVSIDIRWATDLSHEHLGIGVIDGELDAQWAVAILQPTIPSTIRRPCQLNQRWFSYVWCHTHGDGSLDHQRGFFRRRPVAKTRRRELHSRRRYDCSDYGGTVLVRH